MKTAIDCRYLGLSGLGRFTEGILSRLPEGNEYLFWGDPEKINKFCDGEILPFEGSPFSLKGLFANGDVIKKINECDAFFTPNFILPYGLRVKIYSVIHDVVFMDLPKETTNGVFDRVIKKHLLRRCLKKSEEVFTVSEFSRKRIAAFFGKSADKVTVAYNGVPSATERYAESHVLPAAKENYIVYCGNIKKHKGLHTLLRAFAKVREKDDAVSLYIVGSAENHRTSDAEIMRYFDTPGVRFTGRLDDESLYDVISRAKLLVQPSLYEGFGMPPLEALVLRTKPIISDIEVFREIYGDSDVCFFECENADELAEKICTASPECDGIIPERFDTTKQAEIIFGRIGNGYDHSGSSELQRS